jgi:DNA polymerase IV
VTVKIRFADHTDVTRSHTLPLATDRTHDLVAIGRHLLDGLHLERVRVRLIGFRLAGLGAPEQAAQLSLLDAQGEVAGEEGIDAGERWAELDRTADAIASRFGMPAVSFAALLDDDETPEP